jgi:antitoxin CptB
VTERHEDRIKRLRMRSMRRGIKEMDLILDGFARAHLAGLSGADLDLYEILLEENDLDIYRWISGQAAAPDALAPLVARIAAGAMGIVRPA